MSLLNTAMYFVVSYITSILVLKINTTGWLVSLCIVFSISMLIQISTFNIFMNFFNFTAHGINLICMSVIATFLEITVLYFILKRGNKHEYLVSFKRR